MKHWFHGTTHDRIRRIEANGFQLEDVVHGRRFGHGVYFTDWIKNASGYGGCLIIANIHSTEILKMGILDWIKVEDVLIRKYGTLQDVVANYVTEQGYKALCIQYQDLVEEMVVYDLSLIEVQEVREVAL